MASTRIPFASKGRRVAIAPESTIGTPETAANAQLVPATEFSFTIDRGTGIIDRSAVLDGFAGGMCRVPGSRGVTATLSTEIHDISNPGGSPDSYFTNLLLAAGLRASDDALNDDTSFAPSNRSPVNATSPNIASGGTSDPGTLTVYNYLADDSGATTFQNRFSGCTAGLELVLNSGERAIANFSMVGTLDSDSDWMDTADPLLPTSYDSLVSCKPYVVRNITATLADSGGDPAEVVTLNGVTINYNSETPENTDPTQQFGFGISPVLHNTNQTISFTIGASDENNGIAGGAFEGFWQAFRDGSEMSLQVVLDTGDSATNTMDLRIDKLQYTGVSWGDAGGYVTYEIEAVVVRDPGTQGGPLLVINHS